MRCDATSAASSRARTSRSRCVTDPSSTPTSSGRPTIGNTRSSSTKASTARPSITAASAARPKPREKEVLEDRFFSGNPDGQQYENHESVDSAVWVPEGYVCIRVDSRGVGRSPGLQAPFSVQQSEDYYDAIEWAGTQPWSNGKVGLWGMSYLAMTQHMVASLQPSHLKAMIAIGTDADLYNEATYGGGLFGVGFWDWWWKVMSGHNAVGARRETDWMARLRDTPFNDPQAYGPRGSIFMRPELEKATAPVWVVGPQTGVTIHQLGSSETYIHSTGASARRFDFVDAWFPGSYTQSSIAEHRQFFDHWLKGEDNGVMDAPPVRVQVRTGNGAHLVLHEQEWPIARTTYRRWYLDASPSDWTGDAHRNDLLRIVEDLPATEQNADYDAHLDLGRPIPAPIGHVGGTPRWSTGVSFVSDPMQRGPDPGRLHEGRPVGVLDQHRHGRVRVPAGHRRTRPRGPLRVGRAAHRPGPPPPGRAWPAQGLAPGSRTRPVHRLLARAHPCRSRLPAAAARRGRPRRGRACTPVPLSSGRARGSASTYSRTRRPASRSAPTTRATTPARRNAIFTGPEHTSYIQLPIVPPN